MKFRKKPVVIEAITFEELVAHGIALGVQCHNGMPWSFEYQGQHITHENDHCYIIPTLEGSMKFNRGEMLITGVKGEIYPCKRDIFEATYSPAVEPVSASLNGLDKKLDRVLSSLEKGLAVPAEKSHVHGPDCKSIHCLP